MRQTLSTTISQEKKHSQINNMNRNRVTLVLGICALYQVAHGIPVPSLNPEDYENSHKPAPYPFLQSVSRAIPEINPEDIENSHKPAPDPFLASASRMPLINPEDIENSHKPAPEPFFPTDSNSRGHQEPALNPEDFVNSHKPAPDPFL